MQRAYLSEVELSCASDPIIPPEEFRGKEAEEREDTREPNPCEPDKDPTEEPGTADLLERSTDRDEADDDSPGELKDSSEAPPRVLDERVETPLSDGSASSGAETTCVRVERTVAVLMTVEGMTASGLGISTLIDDDGKGSGGTMLSGGGRLPS